MWEHTTDIFTTFAQSLTLRLNESESIFCRTKVLISDLTVLTLEAKTTYEGAWSSVNMTFFKPIKFDILRRKCNFKCYKFKAW